MIKLHFFDWDSCYLDVENELNINSDVTDFLVEHVSDIQLEVTDNQFDLENNWIFWFSAKNEKKAIKAIYDILFSRIKPDSCM
ncbi:MAG: hypothetical protein K2G88_06550, partial [Oscillospiraceae bacterium]|nr:hypothetical protein [Oscillospiraceae bacterium]